MRFHGTGPCLFVKSECCLYHALYLVFARVRSSGLLAFVSLPMNPLGQAKWLDSG